MGYLDAAKEWSAARTVSRAPVRRQALVRSLGLPPMGPLARVGIRSEVCALYVLVDITTRLLKGSFARLPYPAATSYYVFLYDWMEKSTFTGRKLWRVGFWHEGQPHEAKCN